jgi:hypothetical protein
VRRAALTLIGALSVSSLAACSEEAVSETPPAQPKLSFVDPAMIEQFQERASASCECAKGKLGKERASCWTQFQEEIAPCFHEQMANECGPGSVGIAQFWLKPETFPEDEDLELFFLSGRGKTQTIWLDYGYGTCRAENLGANKAAYEAEHGEPGC